MTQKTREEELGQIETELATLDERRRETKNDWKRRHAFENRRAYLYGTVFVVMSTPGESAVYGVSLQFPSRAKGMKMSLIPGDEVRISYSYCAGGGFSIFLRKDARPIEIAIHDIDEDAPYQCTFQLFASAEEAEACLLGQKTDATDATAAEAPPGSITSSDEVEEDLVHR